MAKKAHKSIPVRIKETLAKVPGGLTTDVLAKRVKADGSSVSSACSKLVKAGELERRDGATGPGSEAVWAVKSKK